MSLKPKVALSNDFLLQLSKLPLNVHTKVMKWAIQFQADPTSPGINYENINGARDSNLKSVRLDKDWRGIVFKPSSGDVYVLLYVDHHDDAYRWAENRKLTINPVTGAMQMVTFEHVAEPAQQNIPPGHAGNGAEAPPSAVRQALFIAFDDRELMSLGVPQELLGMVRGVTSDDELDAIQSKLPVEAYEGLFLVAAGDTVSEVLNARETRVDRVVDTADFSAALATPESQSRFVVVSDDETLAAILNAPLAQWRVFLHPTQQKLSMGDRSGPVRVLGGAGTGKTVLAMHRAKWLAENRTGSSQKVLFTTFTRNLAGDIEQNLKTLCSASTLAKLEVRNLDAWVNSFMRSRKLEHRIVYDRKQDGAMQAWQAALAVRDTSLDLPDNFYEQELEHVVLAQGITTLDEYRTARRTGRAVILGRGKRDAVWPVFEEYRGQLASRKLKEVDDAYREVAGVLTAETTASVPYSAIVVDETQDFGPQALKLLRAMIPRNSNDLFFVGDGHQRIYSRHKAAMSKCGIDIRGRSRKLYINYRTTDEIRRQAVALLEGIEVDDLDDGHDEARRYRSLSHGPVPVVAKVEGLEGAFSEVTKFLQQWQSTDSAEIPVTCCVVTSSEKSRDAIAQQLQMVGVRTVAITAQSNHTDERGAVYMSTMHRAKGLEFDCVAVVAPKSYVEEQAAEGNQRQLLYVALTRAKRGAALVLY
ncbi:UvrD-helicase domain-containing protein [Cupriavidus metallidurans]|uniref:UvrD-helicase domain-containing protein n=1 Tax=Cupriavidus metallidurans TaxID=119219 RepID=UPI001CCD503C|nr:UvrD-helicase domain-containing protein [Cupriavidus metallidurans]UBM09979.1 AAA family ATPase [Cupriavidus metallidurans]